MQGEAGIGKTTLWRAAVELARERSYQVLLARSEAGMPFVGLGDLFGARVPPLLDELPGPQRQALESALLLGDPGSGTHPRTVAAARSSPGPRRPRRRGQGALPRG